MNKSTTNTANHHNNGRKSSPPRAKSSQQHSNQNAQKNRIHYMNKKVKISQEKLLAKTRKVYDSSGADNKCEAKSLHLLCRAVNAQFNISNSGTNSASNSLCTLQSKVEDRFNPTSEAWKHAFILVISFLKRYQMELSLATVIVETPKEIEVRNYKSFSKVPFPISMKHFSSSEDVSRIFNDLMRTKNAIQHKSFTDKLNEFIEDMEMEDFWQRNPLLVFSSRFVNTLSVAQTEKSSNNPEPSLSSAKGKQSIIQKKGEDIDNDNVEEINTQNEKIISDHQTTQRKVVNVESSSTKKGTKKKRKGKKKKE